MDHILEPNAQFEFSNLTMVSPTALSGGVYFIRILTKDQTPVYIQSPKCTTKQGIIKTNKKMHSDLVFKHENESFLEFWESMESYCQKKLYEYKEKWFDSDLSEDDIENSFTPITKSYKSGKFFIIRVNIPIRLGKSNLKIFDENENDLSLDRITDSTNMMTIMELQGIRCTSRNFQLEIELKQVMVMNDVNLFEKCIFARPGVKTLAKEQHEEIPEETAILPESSKSDMDLSDEKPALIPESGYDTMGEEDPTSTLDDLVIEESPDEYTETPEQMKMEEESVEEIPIPESSSNNLEDLCEVNFDSAENLEEITLKNQNDIYYEMYQEAKKKARIARDLAITSYLQAKQIKTNYLMENDTDDDDLETEESELNKLELDD